METPQERFAKFKTKAGPSPADASQRFQKYKDTLDGNAPQNDGPKTLFDYAKEEMKKNGGALGGALVFGAMTGGMGVAPALGMAALGAGGGEAYSQLTKRFSGGEKLEPQEAASRIAKQAITNMLLEGGFKVVGKAATAIKNMTPNIAISLLKMPAEAVRRAIKNPSIIKEGGYAAKDVVETAATKSLSAVQQALVESRQAVGHNVGVALEDLQKTTKGAKIFDTATVAKNTREYMMKKYEAADPTIREMVGKDIDKIESLLKTMEDSAQGAPGIRPTKAGLRDAKTMNKIKQTVQELTNFNKRGLPEVASDLGQDTLRELGKQLRTSIEDTANIIGHDGLKKANKEAKAVYDAYDEVRPMLSTTKTDPYTILGKVNRIATDFHSGGMKQRLLNEVGKNFPQAAKPMNELLDHISAKAFTADPAYVASGNLVGAFVRNMMTPENLGKTIKATSSPGMAATVQGGKMLTRAGVMMSAPADKLPMVNVNNMLNPPEEKP